MADTKISAPATKLINNVSVSTSDIKIDPSRSLWFRLFTPTTNSDMNLPLIIYFHGGGFRSSSPDTKAYDDLCTNLAAKTPAVIASVNYRLTPKYKYPSQYDDGYDALKFIDAQNAAVLPAYTDLRSCFIAGDSAGGNIAHHVTVRALKNGDHFNRIRIAGVVSVQPFFGGEERTESEMRLPRHPTINVEESDIVWAEFLPEGADRNHPAVHVFGDGSSSDELKNLDFPATLVVVGGNDPLLDWEKRYVEWLKNCGKEVEMTMFPNVEHGFYSSLEFPELPEFDLLFQSVADFIKNHLHLN